MRSKKGSLAEIQNQLAHQSVFFPIVLNRRHSQDCSKLLTNERNGNDILRPLGAWNFSDQSRNFADQSRLGGTPY
jgi:hypothetical protein